MLNIDLALADDDTRDTLNAMMLAADPTELTFNTDDLDFDDSINDTHRAIAELIADDFCTLLHDADARNRLADAFDLCRLHLCDIAICYDDDDPTCAHLR